MFHERAAMLSTSSVGRGSDLIASFRPTEQCTQSAIFTFKFN